MSSGDNHDRNENGDHGEYNDRGTEKKGKKILNFLFLIMKNKTIYHPKRVRDYFLRFPLPFSGISLKNWTEGPMARAKATVPTPTEPPRKNPVTSIIISMELRISRILFPVFLLNPNIKPSLGPAPRFALI